MANIDLSGLNYATVDSGTVYNSDGTVRTATTDNTTSSLSSASSGTDMGYDQFLTLLCAEMQYQDPLEPTSNTEYVAQLASFSQLEATLSMQETATSMQETLESGLTSTLQTVETNMASSLVGKYVILNTTDSSGTQTYVDGKVDYIMYDTDGSVLLSVNDGLYSLSTLDTVADEDYYEGVVLSNTIGNMLEQLPDVDEIDATYQTAVSQIREVYDGMTSSQQEHVSSDNLTKLETYEAKIEELVKAAEEAAENTTEDVVTEENAAAEETSDIGTA